MSATFKITYLTQNFWPRTRFTNSEQTLASRRDEGNRQAMHQSGIIRQTAGAPFESSLSTRLAHVWQSGKRLAERMKNRVLLDRNDSVGRRSLVQIAGNFETFPLHKMPKTRHLISRRRHR